MCSQSFTLLSAFAFCCWGVLLDSRVLSPLPPSRSGDSSTEVKIVLIHSALVLLALLYKVAVPECSQTKRIRITSYTLGTVLALITFIKAAQFIVDGEICRRSS